MRCEALTQTTRAFLRQSESGGKRSGAHLQQPLLLRVAEANDPEHQDEDAATAAAGAATADASSEKALVTAALKKRPSTDVICVLTRRVRTPLSSNTSCYNAHVV